MTRRVGVCVGEFLIGTESVLDGEFLIGTESDLDGGFFDREGEFEIRI